MYNSIKELYALDESKYGSVSFMAILDSIENGGITSTGKPYVKGLLTDRESSISFKVWGYTLEDLKKKITKPLAPCALVNVKGSLQVAPNGQLDFIVGYDSGSPAIKVFTKTSVLPYVYTQPFDETVLFSQIERCVSMMNDDALRAVCSKALSMYGEQMRYYPYSTRIHKERGGAMYHITRCLNLVDVFASPITVGSRKVDVNYDLIHAAIICHRLGIYTRYNVHPATGKIIEPGEASKVLFGQMDNFTAFLRLLDGIEDSELLQALKHMILLVNMPEGTLNPAYLEAQIFADVVHDELRTYSYAEVDVEAGSTTPVIPSLGHKVVSTTFQTPSVKDELEAFLEEGSGEFSDVYMQTLFREITSDKYTSKQEFTEALASAGAKAIELGRVTLRMLTEE